jgi:hypothetical protein
MNSRVKVVAAGIASILVLVIASVLWFGMIGHNNTQNWQVYQSVTGNIQIIDTAGYYWKGFGTVWTYSGKSLCFKPGTIPSNLTDGSTWTP